MLFGIKNRERRLKTDTCTQQKHKHSMSISEWCLVLRVDKDVTLTKKNTHDKRLELLCVDPSIFINAFGSLGSFFLLYSTEEAPFKSWFHKSKNSWADLHWFCLFSTIN